MAEAKAQLNHLRISPRKVRLVVKPLRGMKVSVAKFQLAHITRKPTISLAKLLDSAVANAKNNFSMVEDNLYIKEIIVNEGATLKRFRPKAFGRAGTINKRTSHITLVLNEKVPGLKVEKEEKETMKPKEENKDDAKKQNSSKAKEDIKKSPKETGKKDKKGETPKGIKRIFRRKV